jgi:hypothetical protein
MAIKQRRSGWRWLLAAAIARGLFGVLQFLLPE